MIDDRRLTEHFHKEMDSLQVCELVVVSVNADAKKETCVSPVHDFVIPKLTSHIEYYCKYVRRSRKATDLDKV